MIAFMQDHPLVRLPDQSLHAFQRRWLLDSLASAAEKAGEEFWWGAPHVAESVSAFLREDYADTVIDAPRLEAMVRSCLQKTGFTLVAREFSLLPPPARVSLTELAVAAGQGYELQFFQLLSTRLRDALADGCRRIECADLFPAVKILRQARRWRADCRGLRSEIVSFIRQQAKLAGAENLRIELS
jgi:hypothetical protein